MSDLDKLMDKLKVKSKPLDEVKNEDLEKLEPNGDEEFDDVDDVNDEEEVEETPAPTPEPAQKPKVIPKVEKLEVKAPAQEEKVEEIEHPIDAEVGLLQSNGIFRRELLLTFKELVEVQKASAEILILIQKELKK